MKPTYKELETALREVAKVLPELVETAGFGDECEKLVTQTVDRLIVAEDDAAAPTAALVVFSIQYQFDRTEDGASLWSLRNEDRIVEIYRDNETLKWGAELRYSLSSNMREMQVFGVSDKQNAEDAVMATYDYLIRFSKELVPSNEPSR